MKKILLFLVLGISMFGCKVQSMYESEPNSSFYRDEPEMIFYDNYGYYHPFHLDAFYYQNGIYDRSRINMDYDFGIRFDRKYRKHPVQKQNYKPIEVKPYKDRTIKQKPNEGNKQWGERIINQQNQNIFHQSPTQNNYQQNSSPSRQVTQPQQNTQSTPLNSTRQGRPVEK